MNNKEIVRSWFQAIDAKDLKAVKNLLDSNYKFRSPANPSLEGAEERIEIIREMTSAFQGKYQLDQIFAEGDNVAVSGCWKGTHIGEYDGVLATNKKVEFYFVDVFKLVNGKIVSEHLELNPSTILAQIGVVPVHA